MEEISIEDTAVDFVDRFYQKLQSKQPSVGDGGLLEIDIYYWRQAKECALIAADELELMAMIYDEEDIVDWWQQIKKQIELL